MTKILKILALSLMCIMLVTAMSVLVGCNQQDDTAWDLTKDGSVKASFADNGNYGFILTVEGNGAMPDYDTVKHTPWYSKSGRVTDIVISEGITYIGNNSFTNCATDIVVVAKSVTSIGDNAFSQDTIVCAYDNIECGDDVNLYLYSANKPTTAGNYWYLKDNQPCVWKSTKVLFIGNSFTYYSDIPKLFESIANSVGCDVIVQSITKGAHTLEQFADTTDEYGKIVDQTLKGSDDFDIIVLQEQSTRPIDNYNAFLSGVTKLKEKINSTQKDCEIYLYSTWGYQEVADNMNKTIPEVEASIRSAYDKVAKALDLKVSYVGKAFSTAFSQYPQINLYYTDNKHPSYQGAFLSACVHVATIFQCDVTQSTFVGELDESTAILIKTIADQTVFGN